jgi:hypothetical protein
MRGEQGEEGHKLDASTADNRETRCWAPGLNSLAFCTPKLVFARTVLMYVGKVDILRLFHDSSLIHCALVHRCLVRSIFLSKP